MLVCAHCGSRNVKPSYDAEAHATVDVCMMCARDKFVEKMEEPVIKTEALNKEATIVEEEIISRKHKTCRISECTKLGSFDQMCAHHFKETHGIGYGDFQRRRKSGETKEQILANPSGPQKEQREQLSSLGGGMPKQPERETGETVVEPAPASQVIVVFVNHPELAEKLMLMARADFRSPEGQILYLIDQADKFIERLASHG